MKPVKYLVSGWLVTHQLDGTDIYKPFKRIVTEYPVVEGYLKLMAYRNSPYTHTKVDNIECIYGTED